MKRMKEKRGIEIVQSMNSNFAKETNQRDEDAEMQKFIEEQLHIKKELEIKTREASDKKPNESLVSVPTVTKFKRPEDALFDVPKYLIENTSKHKSEETLSEQMLSGIPEVDLGIDERIRNIEETERAKQKILSKKSAANNQQSTTQGQNLNRQVNDSQYAPQNTSVNFVQHKRFDDALINPDHMIKPRLNRPHTSKTEIAQPVVGDAPKHELLQQTNQTHISSGYSMKSKFNRNNNSNVPTHNSRKQYFVSTNMNEKEPEVGVVSETKPEGDVNIAPPTDPVVVEAATSQAVAPAKKHKRHHTRTNQTNEKASDEYCLERFKKNMRFNRSSKIKIC